MKNLNLSLYAFHLCQSLDDAPDTHSKDAGLLWDSLRGLAAKIPFPELKKITEPTEANPETSLDFQAIEINHISLTGNLSTFKIHDTYSVDLTLSFQDKQAHFFPGNVVIFQPQALIDVTANLGKVLWLSGESEDVNELQLTRATQWAEQLCQQATYIEEDHLFNSPLFIFAADSVTILISLAEPNAIDLERAQENYYNLRNLFWTYQKIVVVEKLAKEGYQGARKLYSELEAQVQEFNQVFLQTPEERLKKLDELLQTIPQRLLDYNCKLRDLKANYTTIDVNWKNFKVSLSHILDESAGDKLSYWSDFATKTAPLYLTQIKTYIDYLEPGQVLFSDLINSIRATAEIEQVKSDRQRQQAEKDYYQQQQDDNQKLQNRIQAVGVGIAAGAIFASTAGSINEPWLFPNGQKMEVPFLPPHPFLLGLLGSIICSVGAWWLAETFINPGKNKSDKSSNQLAKNQQNPKSN
ncbi:hypothetical protein [Oscillatoria acuminata]|uniref:Uncharacterized protein n=1 Tax=Oscillatoria acuminata PCC 6304 TaxID=56110 RepID=K9TD52_9CYAN|nr:hypothetical protein [Oscillatoria acuminata]AFY79939.1 hypothetical protein Oscil6304_0185 [Oscillatoria acuminata PCC 6304]